MKRTRINPVSDKRRATWEPRRQAMTVVRERDRYCQFFVRLVVWAQTTEAVDFSSGDGPAILAAAREAFGYPTPDCFGPLNGHEPRKQAHHPEDYLDPERIVLLCDGHNSWVEDWPDARKLLAL